MPRQRIRKTHRGIVDTAVYTKTVDEYFLIQAGNTNAKVRYRCVNRVFNNEEEKLLKGYVIQCSKVYFSLTTSEMCKLAYELAVNVDHMAARNC